MKIFPQTFPSDFSSSFLCTIYFTFLTNASLIQIYPPKHLSVSLHRLSSRYPCTVGMPGGQVAGGRGGVGRRWGRGRSAISARRRGVALQLRLRLPLRAPLELDGLLDGVRVDELHHADLLGYGLAHLLRGQVRDLRQGTVRDGYREIIDTVENPRTIHDRLIHQCLGFLSSIVANDS